MATNAKSSAIESSKMTDAPQLPQVTNNSNSFDTMENSMFPEVQPTAEQIVTTQSKSSRSKAKPRRSNIEDYRKDFFTPIKLTPKTKHQVSISNDTFDRIERIARHFGGRGYTVGSFVEHILIDHLEAYADIYDGWYSQLGKSL